MIWLTWRQHRVQLIALGVALVGMTAILIADRLSIAEPNAAFQACRANQETCSRPSGLLDSIAPIEVMFLLPLLVGMFLGAPLIARELEQGTHRVAWTQGVSRRRWLATKLGIVLTAAAITGLVTGAVFCWWFPPMVSRYPYVPLAMPRFDLSGMVPIGHAVFALALGIAAGTLLKRTIPAMAVTLVGFIGVRIGVQQWRHYFLPPREVRYALTGTDAGPSIDFRTNMVLKDDIVDRFGNAVHESDAFSVCEGTLMDDSAVRCLAEHGYQARLLYRPPSRFWTFQVIETGVFLTLAAILLAAVAWWVLRRSA